MEIEKGVKKRKMDMKHSIKQKLKETQLPANLGYLNPVVVGDLIRLGNKRDGGYVIPKSIIANLEAHIFFGVGDDWSFEQDLVKLNPNLTVHAYDHTIDDKVFFKAFILAIRKFLLFSGSINEIRTRLARYKLYNEFFKSNALHFQERVFNRIDNCNDATIEKIFARLDKYNISIKMDIEGDEYRVIDDLITYQNRISLLVIEFHNTDSLREIFSKKIKSILEHFNIVHIHGNNFEGISKDNLPEVLEITFLHKHFYPEPLVYRNYFPVLGLDFPNNPLKPDYKVAFT